MRWWAGNARGAAWVSAGDFGCGLSHGVAADKDEEVNVILACERAPLLVASHMVEDLDASRRGRWGQ